MRITAAKIGKGKAVHIYYPAFTRTDCATGGMGDADATVVDLPITCKRCLRVLAARIEDAHGEAVEENTERLAAAGPYVTVYPGSNSNPGEDHVVTPFAVWSSWSAKVGPIKGERFRSAREAQARQIELNPCGGRGCGQVTYDRPHKPSCRLAPVDMPVPVG